MGDWQCDKCDWAGNKKHLDPGFICPDCGSSKVLKI